MIVYKIDCDVKLYYTCKLNRMVNLTSMNIYSIDNI